VTRLHLSHFVQCDLIVAADDRRSPKFAEVLGEVEGERIVVIEQEYHG
jgi:hypothetical protein